MLTKHVILENIANDNIRRLGNYIADASHEGEKCLESWATGCLAPDYQSSILEIEATQALNTRSKKEKTYHLIISFRAGDEEKLTKENYRDIEKEIAKSLGFENHQRLCGIHQNTNNIHMHIAYNMIDPVKFARHEPYRDQPKMRETAKILCDKYGLSFDEPKDKKNSINIAQQAAAMEAHTGEQSFQSFVLEHKKDILDEINKNAKNWEDIHSIFKKYGMTIKPRGNGFVIADEQSLNCAIKASAVDRSLSKSNLTKIFGNFEDFDSVRIKEKQRETPYTKQPLYKRNPARDELYKKYKKSIEEKKRRIAEAKRHNSNTVSRIFDRYNEVKEKIQRETFSKRSYYSRIFAINPILQKQLNDAKELYKKEIANIQNDHPFYNWHDYLKHEALKNGNKIAADILRNKNTPTPKEEKKKGTFRKEYKLSPVKNADAKKMYFLFHNDKQNKNRVFSSFKEKIDNRGNIIYEFKHGGVIRDCGEKIYFSTDDRTEKIATLYALTKFGKQAVLRGNYIEARETEGRKTYKQPNPAIIRNFARNGMRTLPKFNVVFGRRKEKTSLLLYNNAQHDMER